VVCGAYVRTLRRRRDTTRLIGLNNRSSFFPPIIRYQSYPRIFILVALIATAAILAAVFGLSTTISSKDEYAQVAASSNIRVDDSTTATFSGKRN
jgi:hypothetical protein